MRKTPLQLRRAAAGKTQRQVATEAGITGQYYQRIEAGRAVPSVKIAQKLAISLGSSVEDLWPIGKKVA